MKIQWGNIFRDSWLGKIQTTIERWWVSSILFNISQMMLSFLVGVFRGSLVYHYANSNHVSFSLLFRRSMILQQTNRLVFRIVGWINNMMQQWFSGSLIARLFRSFFSDMGTNPVKYLSSLVFSGFTIWVIFTLLVGGGFSKLHMSIILAIAFMTWFLSHLDIHSKKVFVNSRFIVWFLNWAEAEDFPKRTKKTDGS